MVTRYKRADIAYDSKEKYNMPVQKVGIMRMQKRQFRIGELAKKLNVEKFVIRFWEKEFNLKSYRSDGGQRFYAEDDLETFILIKDLLYNQGFTISGAKQKIKQPVTHTSPRIELPSEPVKAAPDTNHDKYIEQCIELKEQLIKLQKLLQ